MNRLLPVIHLVSYDQMCENIDTCLDLGVDQIFLINHNSNFQDLIFYANQAKMSYPELKIGLNFLDLTPKEALRLKTPFAYEALWIDRTLSIDDTTTKNFTGEVFSGLNFKYQKQFYGDDLKDVVELIKKTSTVACTSGEGTGQEAPMKKIENLKELLGDFPLALASGVSSPNVELYLPYVEYFLVASSITDRHEHIIKDKLKELLDKIK